VPTHLVPGAGVHASQAAIATAARAAAARGFDDTFWLAAGIAGLALPAAMLLRRPIPEGERLLVEQRRGELRHPALTSAVRAAFVVLLISSLVFLAFTIAKAVDAI
nr:hypothetical protein [Candidatus Dormibacteraeota bacterium]